MQMTLPLPDSGRIRGTGHVLVGVAMQENFFREKIVEMNLGDGTKGVKP